MIRNLRAGAKSLFGPSVSISSALLERIQKSVNQQQEQVTFIMLGTDSSGVAKAFAPVNVVPEPGCYTPQVTTAALTRGLVSLISCGLEFAGLYVVDAQDGGMYGKYAVDTASAWYKTTRYATSRSHVFDDGELIVVKEGTMNRKKLTAIKIVNGSASECGVTITSP